MLMWDKALEAWVQRLRQRVNLPLLVGWRTGDAAEATHSWMLGAFDRPLVEMDVETLLPFRRCSILRLMAWGKLMLRVASTCEAILPTFLAWPIIWPNWPKPIRAAP